MIVIFRAIVKLISCGFARDDYIPALLNGEVAEWSKAHAWNACRRETVSRVRIPVSPPEFSMDFSATGLWRISPEKSGTCRGHFYQRRIPMDFRVLFQAEISTALFCVIGLTDFPVNV